MSRLAIRGALAYWISASSVWSWDELELGCVMNSFETLDQKHQHLGFRVGSTNPTRIGATVHEIILGFAYQNADIVRGGNTESDLDPYRVLIMVSRERLGRRTRFFGKRYSVVFVVRSLKLGS